MLKKRSLQYLKSQKQTVHDNDVVLSVTYRPLLDVRRLSLVRE